MALEQRDPQARALERACDEAYAVFQEKAAVVADLWKKASKIVFSPDTAKAHRVVDEQNEYYPEFAVAEMEKQEALVAFQRAQHAHGDVLHDVRK